MGPLVMGRKSQTSASRVRALATIQGNTPRQQPSNPRQRATEVSHDAANLTIRDGPVFNGKSFGAKSNISGEAVFTTSLVGA